MAWAAYLEARHEVDELLDAHLVQAAGILAAQLSEDGGKVEIEHAPQLHRYARRVAFLIWERGRLRLHSLSAPASRLASVDQGFGFGEAEGKRWRVFSVFIPIREALIQVGERIKAREELSQEIAGHLLMPIGVGVPLLGLALTLAIGRGLKPLTDLAQQVSARDPRRLEPIPIHTVPAEIQPMVDQLNTLFGRVVALLENERRFTADASHELRTPIAAIRAQAQVAREATDSAERRDALDRLIQGCDQANRLIEQLLTLARLDAGNAQAVDHVCDLRSLSQAVLADLGPRAHRRGIALEFEASDNPRARGDETLLYVLVRNLVDNAVRYSRSGTVVTVCLKAQPSGITLEVIDQGPGIPATERERVMGRFHRLAGFEFGTGLGLSIARGITELCRAELTLRDNEPHGGLRAIVSFPTL